MQIYLFACVHHADRSQTATAFFNQLAGADKAFRRGALLTG